jgi:hypothetical protein
VGHGAEKENSSKKYQRSVVQVKKKEKISDPSGVK